MDSKIISMDSRVCVCVCVCVCLNVSFLMQTLDKKVMSRMRRFQTYYEERAHRVCLCG